MKIVPREATLADIPKMVEFGEEFWTQTSYYKQGNVPYDADNTENLVGGMIDLGGIVLLAENEEGDVVAVLVMLVTPMLFNPAHTVASEMVYYVSPEYRKGGLGIRMLKKAEQVAKAKGVKYISMVLLASVEPERPAAVYNRLGYHQTEATYSKEL